MSAPPPTGSFSLFPKDPARPSSRSQNNRPHPTVSQSLQEASMTAESPSRGSPSRAGRQTPLDQRHPMHDHQPISNGRSSAADEYDVSAAGPSIIQRPEPVADIPGRCDTGFSDAQTLVRNSSNRSRSSIAKRPLSEMPQPSEGVRSIFPQYNPELPLGRQDYYPTQTSPSHVPRGAISRHLYSPVEEQPAETPSQRVVSPAPMPLSAGSAARRWPPPRSQEKPVVPPTSTNEELRSFWKVANGWKASASEGRVYCMKMSSEKDAPVYTLSSATQPLYSIRLDPTSASAYVSMSRHDPSKPFKGPANPPGASASSSSLSGKPDASSKGWQEVLTTTLEEESRRHPPEDGLVALLYPTAAARMALDRPGDAATVMTAERECGRLVWDDDTAAHFVVHPALAMPFCVTVERNPAWSRTEYTLEHIESPQHLARLTRDGTGTGWLEVDTGIAAKIDAVYIVDVAVAALLLVAHSDRQFQHVELFEPPPPPAGAGGGERRLSRMSRMSVRRDKQHKQQQQHGGRSRMEEFELDLESQTSENLKKIDVKDKDKLPGWARALIKVLTVTLKCVVWCVTIGFRALAAIISGLAKCLGADK
ncbi:Acetylserotonin methytransferase-like protein [Pleurostoma richardsiae]|uniref:Acetylserotonin methytransferase-like protein n=1 Tax=Pleurostoma richardsiae TaxID=41990 RepID=A0AA38S1A7_9PEZI|nr:Acetylserotonin methytransferase-like protein [Pleurostoma richardsiae]